jgi:rhamnose utilization protein RhaD (predicted bifunctional aldolase and dehydrogenase)
VNGPDRDILGELIALSRSLADPARDCVILAEGNTSARAEDGSFWVKASGAQLRTAGEDDFVRVDPNGVLAMVDAWPFDDVELRRRLEAVRLDPDATGVPSTETLMHAVCLGLDGVEFVGHTHPTPINMITCSKAFEEALSGRLFPDEIVLCGPYPVLIPYVDPGIPLAIEIRTRLDAYLEEHGERPLSMYMQNHGFVALGSTARQVEDITAMAVKAARILAGTGGFGGPHFMKKKEVRRIHTRLDEQHRKKMLDERD